AFIDAPEQIGRPLAELERLRAVARARAEAISAHALLKELKALPANLLEDRERLDLKNRGKLWGPWLELKGQPAAEFSARRRDLVGRRRADAARAATGPFTDFVDFARDSFHDWFVTGDAFGTAPSRVGTAVLYPDQPIAVRAVVGISAALHAGS